MISEGGPCPARWTAEEPLGPSVSPDSTEVIESQSVRLLDSVGSTALASWSLQALAMATVSFTAV